MLRTESNNDHHYYRKVNTEEVESGNFSSKAWDIFRCVFGRREGHTRAVILILISAMLLHVSQFSKLIMRS